MKITEADFERTSWHDCHIRGLSFDTGDAEGSDWADDIIFDIDFIVEWIGGAGSNCEFLVSPATLTFHGVTDPKIHIDWGDSQFQTSIQEVSIDRIEREPIKDQKVFLDRPYYRWEISMNSPQGGKITFGAVGFTQILRRQPTKSREQYLSLKERAG